MIRDLFSVATLRALAAHTPRPVPTYPLDPPPMVPRTPPAVVEANGMRLEYDTFGDASHPPLLLVMGLGGQMVAWDEEFCARLAARGFRVIRFDNRDVGRSTWLDDAPVPNLLSVIRAVRRGESVDVPYRVPDMARDAVGLLDALEIDAAHVVGVSLGGMIAQTMAIEAPARVRTLTSIMSQTGDLDLPPPHWRTLASLMVPAPRNREMALHRAVDAWRVLNGPGIAVDRARTLVMAGMAYDRGRNPAGVLRQIAGIVASPSRAEALRSVRIPTLVMHGDRDPMTHVEGGRRTAAAIPGAELAIIPRMGHALAPPFWPRIIDSIAALAARA